MAEEGHRRCISKEMPNETLRCPRCERTFHRFFDNPRFWSGPYTELVEGEVEEYDELCNDCHRELVRS